MDRMILCVRIRLIRTSWESVREGQIAFDPPANAPIIVQGNELIIGGLRLGVNLRQEVTT